MESLDSLVQALSNHPSTALLAISLLALAYMYKEQREREKAHLDTAMQIAPLATKLTDAIGSLERITSRLLDRSGKDE